MKNKIFSMKKQTYIILILTFFFSNFISNAQEEAWELVSMNPPRGNVYSLSKNELDYLFSGAGGGAFISLNKGMFWEKVLDGYCVPIVYFKGNLFTVRFDEKIWKSYFLKSDNFGKTWDEIKDLGTDWITTDDKRILFTAYKNDTTNFYISEDTFNLKKISILPDSLIEKYIDSKAYIKDSLIFQSVTDDQYFIYLVGSKDFGQTWKKYKLPNKYPINDLFIKSKTEYFAASNFGGIFYTSDGGENWIHKWFLGKDVYSLMFVNDSIIFAGTKEGVYYTLDGGNNWVYPDFNYEFNTKSNASLALIVDSQNNIYSSPNYNGIYKSSDRGKTWSETNNGFSAISPNDIVFNNSNEIFLSSWGIFKSTDEGKTFDYLDLKAYDTGPITINSKGYIFVGDKSTGNTYKGILRSTDYGMSWNKVTRDWLTVNALINTQNDVLITSHGPDELEYSTDDGLTWVNPDTYCNYLAINDENQVFSFSGGRIYNSTDDGRTWNKIAETRVDPTYIEFGGRIIFNNKTKTAAYYDLVTTDNGRNWVKQLDNHYIFGTTSSDKYAIDSTYNWVLAGGDYINRWTTHIERSTDNGKTWYRMDTTGLKHKEFKTIGCSPDGHIYVFGATGGLYRSRDKFVSVKEEPKPKADIFNSPNPFSETTHIRFTLLNPGDVRLTVYDLLGNLITTKNYGLLDSGENTILFDGEKYPSGIYFYRIEAGLITVSSSFMNLVK